MGSSIKKNYGDFFEDLDLDKTLDRLLQFVGVEVKCDNVYWVLESEWKTWTKTIWTKTNNEIAFEPDQSLYRNVKVRGLKDPDEKKLLNLCSLFSDMGLSVSVKEHEKSTHICFPIVRPRSKEPLGYILIEGLKEKSADQVAQIVSDDLSQLSKHLSFCLEHWKALSLSFLDDLTGLYNQKYLSMVVENEIYRSSRSEAKFTVLFMDLDFFKSVNDENGHWIGSKALVEMSQVINSCIRRSDYAFRYGGDEFVIILTDTDSKGGHIAAERLRQKIQGHEFIIDGLRLNLTVSIGLATYPEHARSHKDIIKMADEAMYCGKNKSRNVVYKAG